MTHAETIIKQVLSKSQADANMPLASYDLARQYALFRWLESKTRRFGSVGQEAVMSSDLLHREFWHSYDMVVDNIRTIFQVWIIKTSVLADEFPYEDIQIIPQPDAPNLYVAQRSGLQERVILEIDADETAVLQAVIRQKLREPHIKISDLTDDKSLQEQVMGIYQNIKQRLDTREIPYFFDVDTIADDTLYLFLPKDNTEQYLTKLEWFVNHTDFKAEETESESDKGLNIVPVWKPTQKGDVARRLRELAMVKDIGSIRGVYDDAPRTKSNWETLTLLERADTEQRVVGWGTLSLAAGDYHLIVILRDKLNDGIGQHILIRHDDTNYLVVIDGQSNTESISQFDEDMMAYFNERLPQTILADDLQDTCNNWEDGLRIPPYLDVVFKIIEAREGYVTPKKITQCLINWCDLETTQ